MGRIITTAHWIPEKTIIHEIDRGDGKTELTVGLDVMEFLPRKMEPEKKRKPDWMEVLIIMSALIPQAFLITALSAFVAESWSLGLVAVAAHLWSWMVIFINTKNRPSSH